MIHHIVLYKLKPEVTPARVEAMMMNTRMQLLKIPEVLSIKCGKRVDPELQWPFFIAIDFESMDKYAIFREDSIYVKFMEEVIKPNTSESLVLDFEMDPGKDVRFSWELTIGAARPAVAPYHCYFCALRVIIAQDAARLSLFAVSRYFANLLRC